MEQGKSKNSSYTSSGESCAVSHIRETDPGDDPTDGLGNDDHTNIRTDDTTDGNSIGFSYINSLKAVIDSINVHYVIMIDRSSSMAGGGLDAAKSGAISLINSASGTPGVVNNFVIIPFAGSAGISEYTDAGAAISAINGLVASGNTCFDPPYEQSDSYIASLDAGAAVFTTFLSDGESNCGSTPGVGDTTRNNSTVRTMAVGDGADVEALDAMATSGEAMQLTDLNSDSVIDEADANGKCEYDMLFMLALEPYNASRSFGQAVLS